MKLKKIKIGIPRALLYYKYKDLWENFFNELDCEIVCSPETNRKILEIGCKFSIDESCLSIKIYLGHVHYLLNKVDYILVPRIICLKKGEKVCTNFNALYDIVNNTFKTNIIDYNIDVTRRKTEKKAFLNIGKELGFLPKKVLKAYYKAKRITKKTKEFKFIKQELLVLKTNKLKVLIVGHSYNSNDNLIGWFIINNLKQLDVEVILADNFNERLIKRRYKLISEKVYWTYSKELLEALVYYKDKVDGIILLSVFPCGPDSLVNEMCIRKIDKPIINIIIDELASETGLKTRIESFIDIIKQKKEKHK